MRLGLCRGESVDKGVLCGEVSVGRFEMELCRGECRLGSSEVSVGAVLSVV